MGWTAALDGVGLEVLAAVAFLAAYLETIPPIGLVIPGQSAIVATAFLAGRRADGWPVLVAAVTVGAIAGDLTGYILGRRTGLGFLQYIPRRFRPARARLAWLEHLFAEHGVKTVLASRFQPLTRCFAPVLAGAVRMDGLRFVAASVTGALLAAAMLVAGGYVTGLGFERLGKVLGWSVAAVGVVALAGLVLLGLHLRRRHLEQRIEPKVRAVDWAKDRAEVAALLEHYFEEFRDDLGAQDFRRELASIDAQYRPEDAFVVADADGEVVGCVGLRVLDAQTGEVKRMVVHPDWRGAGVGRLLGHAAVEAARERGLRRLVLDTTPRMQAARRLYSTLGFRETSAYYATSPLRNPVFMELDVPAAPPSPAAGPLAPSA